MTNLIANWKPIKDNFTEAIIKQRCDNDLYFTTGKDYETKTEKFEVDRHNPTGALFQKTSHAVSLGQDFLYILNFPLHKVLTAIGKGGLTFWDGGVACKETLFNKVQFSEAVKPALNRLKTFGIDIGYLSVPLALYYQPVWLGYNVYDTLYYTVSAIAIAYSIYTPKGMKVKIADLEDRINVQPLSNSQVRMLDLKGYCIAVLEGTYSLSRILFMNRIGNSEDKTPGNQNRFEYVEKKQD